MSGNTPFVETETNGDKFAAIFATLPPLGSAEYLKVLERAPVHELPAQVLVRAFRQLILAGSEEAANATFVRLLASPQHNYLKAVRRKAHEQVMDGQYVYDEEDLIQETLKQIATTLPTKRGELAEVAWVLFSTQRLEDAWRSLNGRNGEKFGWKRLEPVADQETGDIIDPLDQLDGDSISCLVRLRESNLPWLEDFIQGTVANISDPVIRLIATDQFGDDPSPISSGMSAGGKPPLTDQTGLSRFQVRRAVLSAKARLAAQLLSQREQEIDSDWLKGFLPHLGKPAEILTGFADDNSSNTFSHDKSLRKNYVINEETRLDSVLSPRSDASKRPGRG